jgi:hypothetical protein
MVYFAKRCLLFRYAVGCLPTIDFVTPVIVAPVVFSAPEQITTTGHAWPTTDMSRSRGGLTSRIHAVVGTHGLPVHLALTPGEAV